MFKRFLTLILSMLLISACVNNIAPIEEPEEPIEDVEPEIIVRRDAFNGRRLEDNEPQAPGLAVMIGNTSLARPQAGLSVADVVYEIAVETMQITRYMAIFSSVFPEKVGPIRSVRMPFVTMLDEWDIAIAHYGGSNVGRANAMDVLEAMWVPIRYDGVMNVNPEYFSRDRNRPAPHNAYMNTLKASEAFPDMWPRPHFVFDEDARYEGESIEQIDINYTNDIRNGYRYDPELGRYEKYLNGRPHLDANTNESIYVTNVIIQHAEHSIVERAQYVLVNFYFFGEAEFFINGQHIKGGWIKDSPDDITHWVDQNGEPLALRPGNTWIHVVHDKVKITTK
jgi:hypothetical protein